MPTIRRYTKRTKNGLVTVREHTRTACQQLKGMATAGAEYRQKAKTARDRAHQIQATRKRALKHQY